MVLTVARWIPIDEKEIFEQIETINRSINYGGRIENKTCVKLGGLDDNKDNLLDIKHLIILDVELLIMLGYGVYMSLKVMKFLIQFHVLMVQSLMFPTFQGEIRPL